MTTYTRQPDTERITPPPDFPVQWEQPGDADQHWTRDREHAPVPTTPMYLSCTRQMAGTAHARTLSAYDEAIVQWTDRRINTYQYVHLVPYTGTAEQMAARAQSNRAKLTAASRCLGENWRGAWRPDIQKIWKAWDAFDLQRASLPDLRQHLDESITYGTKLWEYHFRFGPVMWFAIDEFEKCYIDLFPGATRLNAHQLLQGFDNKTMEMSRALWRLSRTALAAPAVTAALNIQPAVKIWTALHREPDAANFLAELRAFLTNYGGRSSVWDWGYPSWVDDPTPVLNHVKNYLAVQDRNPETEQTSAVQAREQASAEARRKLQSYPRPVVNQFETLLQAAQTALVLTEDHTFYLDFNGFGRIHRVMMEIGRRLAAEGRLRRAADVFCLTLPEVEATLECAEINRCTLAAARRAEMDYWAQVSEPFELGARPAQGLRVYSPDARRMVRYVGNVLAEETNEIEETPNLLRGQGGSSGTARGPARLIRSLAEAQRLQRGDILVTTTTAPPWTPLFLTAAAVVTDAGGLLSHGAVVAREYHIPAVVGTRTATVRITDGQMLEVNGDAGEVRWL